MQNAQKLPQKRATEASKATVDRAPSALVDSVCQFVRRFPFSSRYRSNEPHRSSRDLAHTSLIHSAIALQEIVAETEKIGTQLAAVAGPVAEELQATGEDFSRDISRLNDEATALAFLNVE